MPHNHPHMRYEPLYPALMTVALSFIVAAFFMDTPSNILRGLWVIVTHDGALVTDYIALAGVGAALCNAGIVATISVLILHYTEDCLNGLAITIFGLMAGFSLFGKNFLNIWPIILGTYLYSVSKKESFSKYAIPALMTTCLAPIVSYLAIDNGFASIPVGVLAGVVIGFIMPPLAGYTYRIQNGMNIYNIGFASGLVAMILVPMVSSLGAQPTTWRYWGEGYNLPFALALGTFCLLCIALGLFGFRHGAANVWREYLQLLQTSGRSPSDYLRMFGPGPVLVNMGANGLVGMAAILSIGGDLNGPTLGGIFTIMGFSAFGKHICNMVPPMIGVILGSVIFHWDICAPGSQLALLFCTTLAPISGYFGVQWGVLAGFLHSSLVLFTASPVSGMNLYNNGFSGGLVAMFLYPLIVAIAEHRKVAIQDEDFFEPLIHDEPIAPPPAHAMSEERDNA